MLRILIIFCFLTLSACSQKKLNNESLNADSSFSNNTIEDYIEKYFSQDKISNSRNDLEIRLTVEYAPLANFELYILTKKDSNWTATKFKRTFLDTIKNDTKSIALSKISSQQDIKKLFDTLKQNNVFTLKNQKDLKVEDYVDDGVLYTLACKNGKVFRKCEFNNPEIYEQKFPQVEEFTKYLNIVNAFSNSFKRK